jgi:prepilin-type N-terminal cleavage/methylation domain-containing protein
MKFSSQIKMARQQGFTLLELLVVVAVLAIIGGATIASLSGFEKKASQGTATHTISAVEQGIKIYAVSEARLPADLEALACAPFAVNGATGFTALTVVNNTPSSNGVAAADVAQAYKFGGESNVPGVGGGLGKKVADKFDLRAATADEAAALAEAGITSVRYAVTAACDNLNTTVESVTAYGETDTSFGSGLLSAADIPNQAFEDPRPDSEGSNSLKN